MADDPPIRIRPAEGRRSLALALASLCVLAGLAGLSQYNPFDDKDAARAVINVVSAALLIGGGIGIWVTLTTVASLWPDRMELRSGYGYHLLRRDRIAGLRSRTNDPGKLVLILTDGTTVNVPPYVQNDPRGQHWLEAVDDLDYRDYEINRQALESDPALGQTPLERLQNIDRLVLAARIANGGGIAVFFWAWLWPEPYVWAVTAAMLAPLAVFLLERHFGFAFSLEGRKFDPRPKVFYAYLMPVLGLVACTFSQIATLDGLVLFEMICFGALVLTVLYVWLNARVRDAFGVWAFLALLFAGYSYGVILQFDTLLDPSPGTVYPVIVQGKHISGSRHVRHDLDLSTWGPDGAPRRIEVSRGFYDELKAGDRICVRVHPGWLNIRWYEAGYC